MVLPSPHQFASGGSTSDDALLILDRDGRIVHTSAEIERIFGYPRAELIGVAITVLAPKRLRDSQQACFDSHVARASVTTTSTRKELPGLRKDGTEFPALLSFGSYVANGHRYFTAVVRDLSPEIESDRALRASELRYRQLFEANVAGVYRASEEGWLIDLNESFARMLGYERRELIEAPSEVLYFSAEDRLRWLDRLKQDGEVNNYVHRLRRKDGGAIWTLENASLLDDPETGAPVIIGTAIDLTERKALEMKLERMAYRDPLTGLANRRLLREMTIKALARADRDGSTVAMLYMDLVRFKRINDIFGHAVGDRVLREAGVRFNSAIRDTDTLARVGGDEFALLLVSLEDVEQALPPAEALKESLSRPFVIDGEAFHLDVRVGIAGYPSHAATFDELLSKADLSLHQVPDHSAQVAVYKKVTVGSSREEFVMEERLRTALENDEFELHFQPIVEVPGNNPVGVEALARWRMEDGELLDAGEFITVAEHTGLVRELDRWALARAVRYLDEWPENGPAWIALNLAPPTFEDPGLTAYVADLLHRSGVEGSRLALEVTERVAMRDPVRATATLHELQSLNVQIVIDDFGRGHSSLAYLKDFPADALKVDRFFVDGVGVDRTHERLVEGIIALCRSLAVDLIAEGVESAQQLQWLSEHGCSLVQGYYLGRPQPAEELLKLFEVAATRVL